MNKKNFYLFYFSSTDPRSHRFMRFSEEVKKRGFNFKEVNLLRDFYLTSQGLVERRTNSFLEFNKNDLFWTFSNLTEIGYLFQFFKFKGINSWFRFDSFDFSDKFFTGCFLEEIGVSVPKTTFLTGKKWLDKQIGLIGGFPCVIKNVVGSEGKAVGVVEKESELVNFIDDFFKKTLRDENKYPALKIGFLLQEFIAESAGTDYRVLCLEDEIIGGIKRTSQTDDFRANVSLGGKAEAFEVPDDLAKICRQIMKKGKLFYAGLDFIKSNRGWLAIEINTSAQFQGFEAATGINVAGKIVEKIVEKNSFSC